MAFDTPRAPQDTWAAELFERHGLPVEPSLEDIEPVAKQLWLNPEHRQDVAEIMLGRRITTDEISADPLLGELLLMPIAPNQAFGALMLMRSMDRDTQQASA